MERVQLGKTDIQIPRLCLGCWQASGWESSDDRRFIATIRHGIESGANFLDTAESYGKGHSETLVAAGIKGARDKVIIATKFSHPNSKPDKLRKALEGSLKRLRTDYIDLYQQHFPPKSPALDETLLELQKLKEQGKIRAIGVSNWLDREFAEASKLDLIDSLQPCYSLLWRSVEGGVKNLCIDKNISILPYSPLAQGILTGRFKDPANLPKDPRSQNRLFEPQSFPEVLKVVELVEQLAAKYQKTTAQVALRWLLDTPGVTAPIIGCSSREQVDDNLGALGWSLEQADYNSLSELSAPLSQQLGDHDTLWRWHPRA